MTRRAPTTAIINASPQLDRKGMPIMGIQDPLKRADGKHVGTSILLARPLFNMPAPLGFESHWRNEAAKRRCGGDMTKAEKSELVQVPVYRGTSARFMNLIRAGQKRKKRRTLMARMRAEIAARFAKMKEGTPA